MAGIAPISQGRKTAPTVTAEPVVASSTQASHIILSNDSGDAVNANTDIIYVGALGVTVANGLPIRPGVNLPYPVSNGQDIYCISAVAGQKLSWMLGG